MAVIATVADEAPTEDDVVAAFDELAARLRSTPAVTATDVVTYTYGRLGFVGDTVDYYSPDNSLIHRVLRRRRGIPLTLAAVAVEIGRRVGVELTVVGLPGHVLLGRGDGTDRWYDPYAGGAELDHEGCRALFARFHDISAFDQSMLDPLDRAAFATRMLNNLKAAHHRRGDIGRLARVLELTVALPTAGVTEHREHAAVLTALGRYDQAADSHDRLAVLDQSQANRHRGTARRLRAHRN